MSALSLERARKLMSYVQCVTGFEVTLIAVLLRPSTFVASGDPNEKTRIGSANRYDAGSCSL